MTRFTTPPFNQTSSHPAYTCIRTSLIPPVLSSSPLLTIIIRFPDIPLLSTSFTASLFHLSFPLPLFPLLVSIFA